MKTFTLTKKILCVLVIALSMFFVNSFNLLTSLYTKADSVVYYYNSDTSKITNGDFSTGTKDSNGKPNILKSGWSAIEDSSSSSVTSGIINVEVNSFNNSTNNKYGLALNPGTDDSITSSDTNILMIKANSSDAVFGYKSTDITIEADKYYKLSVRCKTGIYDKDTDTVLYDSTASIYTSLSNTENFYNISTSGIWKTFNFFIATDTFDSSTFNIELRLGNKTKASNGAVFFDFVKLSEISNLDFYSASEDNQRIIDFNNGFITSFTNSNFELDDESWTIDYDNEKSVAGIFTASSINEHLKDNFAITANTDIANPYVYESAKSLLIANTKATTTKVETAEANNITIAQHGYYKLSMLIKTGNLSSSSSGLTIALTNNDDITTTQSNLTSSSNSLANYNGFAKVDFYIRGNAWKDTNLSLSFTLGSESEITGWAIVDNITLQKINATEYGKKTTSNEFDLSKNILDTDTITNGSFDFAENNSNNVSYPIAPKDWKASENANNLSGIIRVRTEYFNNDANSFGLTSDDNPGPNTSYLPQGNLVNADTTYENVLMVRNNTNEDVYFTSTSNASLSASSSDSQKIYKIQVAVRTLNNSKAFIKLVDKNGNILVVKDNISSNTDWTNYTLFIKNGISSQDINLRLGTHGNGENNYSFFDYVKYNSEIETSLEDILNTSNSSYTDLYEDNFYNYSTNKNNDLYENTSYSVYNLDTKNQSAIYNGILNTTTSDEVKNIPDAKDNNVLVVTNTVATHQLLTSNYSYKLTESSYYEFSVWVKTEFGDIENLEDYGAIFEIVNVDGEGNITRNKDTRISKIITNTEENNGWVKYSIYLYSEQEQTVKILLGLGNNDEKSLTEGKVYFDNVTAKDITKSVYTSQKASETTLITKVIAPEKENTEENKPSSNNEESGINIWALLSSIILVIALGFAIAGYLIRRIPAKKKIVKVEQSDYDKAPTSVNEKEIKRELKEAREQKLEEINKELEELNKTKNELQAQYEDKSSKEENITIKEKLYANHTKEINKLNKKIDYLQSAIAYSNDKANIKAEEAREIKKRKKEAIEEFNKLKSNSNEDTKK